MLVLDDRTVRSRLHRRRWAIMARYPVWDDEWVKHLTDEDARQLLAIFGMNEPQVVEIGTQLLRVLSVSGLFIAVALTYTGGLQGTGDTKSPLYISIVSQILVPLGICFVIRQTSTLDPIDIWIAILVGHVTRCTLSVVRFNQGKWRTIKV